MSTKITESVRDLTEAIAEEEKEAQNLVVEPPASWI